MDMLDALRLQLEWGADEALADAAMDRRAAQAASRPAAPVPGSTPATPKPAANLPLGPADAARIAAGCASLQALRAAMESFTGCALRDTATQLVFADGDPAAKVVFIGEAPGAEEDRAGRPFIGPAGQLLDKMLASIGLDRTNTRIINTVPWRPPGNRTPTESEIALCLPFLHRHIALMAPACLVLLGAVAAKAMLPEPGRSLGIRRARGHWQAVTVMGLEHPIQALPSFHPAYLLRTPAEKRHAWTDLLALREHIEKINK